MKKLIKNMPWLVIALIIELVLLTILTYKL